jgi:hypothetical protein
MRLVKRANATEGSRGLLRGWRVALVAGVILGGLVATGVSWASIPDPTGQIHGCYNTAAKANGTHPLGVIDPAKTAKCPTGTTPLNWNTGALIYQKTVSFNGPYSSGSPIVASFTIPAGLVCVEASASAYTATATAHLNQEFAVSNLQAPPPVFLSLFANEANSHKALVSDGAPCALQPLANTYNYVGTGFGPTLSDSNDVGSLTVRVYSQ